MYIVVENNLGTKEIFEIGNKVGDFTLKLSKKTKITKIYSLVGKINGGAMNPPPNSNCAYNVLNVTYATDALVSYQLIEYKDVLFSDLDYNIYFKININNGSNYSLSDNPNSKFNNLYYDLILTEQGDMYAGNISIFIDNDDVREVTFDYSSYSDGTSANEFNEVIKKGLNRLIIPKYCYVKAKQKNSSYSDDDLFFDKIIFKHYSEDYWNYYDLNNSSYLNEDPVFDAYKENFNVNIDYIEKEYVENNFFDQDNNSTIYHITGSYGGLEVRFINTKLGLRSPIIRLGDYNFTLSYNDVYLPSPFKP